MVGSGILSSGDEGGKDANGVLLPEGGASSLVHLPTVCKTE